MEILTPWSSQVHHEAQPKGVHATDRNVDSEFIPGYGQKWDILDLGDPRKSDVFFVFGKNKYKIWKFRVFLYSV